MKRQMKNPWRKTFRHFITFSQKLYKYNLCIKYRMVKKKKLKDTFKSFRHNEKASFQTIKTTLKSVLLNRDFVLIKKPVAAGTKR
jgi:hypothetical protein